MATLTLIGEPFPDLEARAQYSASRSLTEALAETAPRGCSSRLLVARDSITSKLRSARASIEAVPMNTGSLPILWRTGATARPLDGEFVHANTPMLPLRSRTEDDGSQTSVYIPHTLAWSAPELMGSNSQPKTYRSYAKRAARLADVLLAPTHAVAQELRDLLGVEVQVLPLAAPSEYLGNEQSAATRATLNLPDRYLVTTALPGANGRLEWVLNAMETNSALPDLVLLNFDPQPLPPVRPSLETRVHVVQVEDLTEVGAVISGAELMVLPQRVIGAGYEVLGALAAHLPVLHSDCDAVAEVTLDASVAAESEEEFAAALDRLTSAGSSDEVQRLRLFAEDRKRSFSWNITAWQLWELHANI